MPASITVYSFEDKDGNEFGSFTTQDYEEAKRYAAEGRLKVIANEYEWSESFPLEDYTPPADEGETLTVYYTCPKCDHSWEEEWDCACDSECPECGTENISPFEYETRAEAEAGRDQGDPIA